MSTKITREIIHIDEEKCDGCGLCVPACAEGAIRIIDGKARLVGEHLCDGLGACLGDCPRGAITIERREADAFDAEAVEEHLRSLGGMEAEAENAAAAAAAGAGAMATGAEVDRDAETITCASEVVFPTGKAREGEGTGEKTREGIGEETGDTREAPHPSSLAHWPIHLRLVPAGAKFLKNSHLLIAGDCVPFAFADFHRRFLKGKTLLVGCPKFDETTPYFEKLVEIFRDNTPHKVTVLMMEVPCCAGLIHLVMRACARAGKEVPLEKVVISIDGKIKTDESSPTA